MQYLTQEKARIQENETPWEYYFRISRLSLSLHRHFFHSGIEDAHAWVQSGRILDPEVLIKFFDPRFVAEQEQAIKSELETAFSRARLDHYGDALKAQYQELNPTTADILTMASLYKSYQRAKVELVRDISAQKAASKTSADTKQKLVSENILAGQTLDSLTKVLCPTHEATFLVIKTNIDAFKKMLDNFAQGFMNIAQGLACEVPEST